MKNLLMAAAFILCLDLNFYGQTGDAPRPAQGYTVVTDTLHYYFNKYYFTAGSSTSNFYAYPTIPITKYDPTQGVSYCGSRFENADTVWVTGLEAFVVRGPINANLQVPARMYLCNLNSAGLPILPAVDSVDFNPPTNIGVVKPGANFSTPRMMLKDFAVLFRNLSPTVGDTLILMRTAGATATSSALQSKKISDGNYSFVRYQGQFYSTRNFAMTSGFGVGTEYEFMVAPRVQYHLQASHKIPQMILDANADLIDTLCTRTPFVFKNMSSYQFTNRFYNLMELYRKWNPVSTFVVLPATGGWPQDSAITWNFEYDEVSPFNLDPRKFLPYQNQGVNHGVVVSSTDQPGCFFDNQFRAKLKCMSPYGRGNLYSYSETFTVCMKYCNGDAVGLRSNPATHNIRVYPQPMVDGKTVVSGISPGTILQVYDLGGNEISAATSNADKFELDLRAFAEGIYVLKIISEQGNTQIKINNTH